jgi:hypothetical protein
MVPWEFKIPRWNFETSRRKKVSEEQLNELDRRFEEYRQDGKIREAATEFSGRCHLD